MTLCDQSIFDYGTFGFWGAYLGPDDKITVTADVQSRRRHLENFEVRNMKDANLKGWIFIKDHIGPHDQPLIP